jgi:hypothetical protein
MFSRCFGNHSYSVSDIEMSRRDPPKALYTCTCDCCGKVIQGHADELENRVASIETQNVDGLPPSMMEVKESYLNGDLDEIEFEQSLNELFDL